MIAAAIASLLEDIGRAAVLQHGFEAIVMPVDARYLAWDEENQVLWHNYVPAGHTPYINRSARLRIEPLAHTRLRPIPELAADWRTT